MKFFFFKKNKKINIEVKKIFWLEKISGLMFRKKNTQNLLFEFKKSTRISIHSWFVFFPFLAVWLDKNKKIVEYKKIKPFSHLVKPKKNFKILLEIPLNKRNLKVVKNIVGKN